MNERQEKRRRMVALRDAGESYATLRQVFDLPAAYIRGIVASERRKAKRKNRALP